MGGTVNLTLPTRWGELTQAQLRYLMETMVAVQQGLRNKGFRSVEDYAAQAGAEVELRCLLKWSGLRVVCPWGERWLVAQGDNEFVTSTENLTAAAETLRWTKDLPEVPVRLDEIDGGKAVAADLSEGFSFDNWLACETLWQGYQLSNDEDMLRQMAEILYRKVGIKPGAAELLGVFYWWASVKKMVAEMFGSFFQPSESGSPEQPTADDLRRSMDAQIRALTKGDITKEKEILAMEAMRALTELDAQAREYEELNRKYGKT